MRDELRDERFRIDYGMFLDDPGRVFALVDEAIYLRERLGGDVSRVLDLGCGFGIHSVLLAWSGCGEVVGIDPSAMKIRRCRSVLSLAEDHPPCRFVSAVAQALPFRDGAFSAVLARESLSHVPEVVPTLQEAERVLAPGGVLHVRDYNNRWGIPGRRSRLAAWKACEEGPAWDPVANPVPFLEKRRRILGKRFPGIPAKRLSQVAGATRGLFGPSLEREALNALGTGRIHVPAEFEYRDPEGGAAEERPFSPLQLPRLLRMAGLESRTVTPRHFHAQKGGLRKVLAEARELLNRALYPVSVLTTPLVECTGRKSRDTRRKKDARSDGHARPAHSLPSVGVVIPSLDGFRDGNVPALIASLHRQTCPIRRVEVVVGISPCGRAHNEGVRRLDGSKEEVVVFLDDDVRLGDDRVIERLARTLAASPDVGIAGASQLNPLDANPFQRACAIQLPRAVFPVVDRFVDADMATHACMAIRRDLYNEVGGEPEDLIHADDQVLRARVREAGLRVGVVPDAWVFHPLPADLRSLLRRRIKQGIAGAHDHLVHPEALFDAPSGAGIRATRRRSLPFRVLRAGVQVAADLACGRWLPVASRIAHAAGFAAGLTGWARPDRRAPRSAEPSRRRPRLLFAQFVENRFQTVDRELLSRRFEVDAIDYARASASPLRWWLDVSRRLLHAKGVLCWFADRHAVFLSLLGRALGKPVVVVVAGYEVASFPSFDYGSRLSRGGRLTTWAALAAAPRLLVNSDYMRDTVQRVYPRVSRKIVRIHHGVDFPSDPSRIVPFPREPVVLTVAEITPANLRRKGLLTFVEAARRVPEYRWRLAGPSDAATLSRLLDGAPANLEHLGFLAEEDLRDLYRRARFYVQISLYEGFGMALAEAMHCGCVPITTGVASLPEVTGPLARVVPPEDPGALARAVRAGVPSREDHEACARRIRAEFPLSRRAAALAALFGEGRRGGGKEGGTR